MLQKTKETYSIDLVETYLKDHPNPKNKDLYSYCNATTNSQKQCVRRKKLSLQKIIDPPGPIKKFTKINPETIEAVLLAGANTSDTKLVNLARAMIEFYIRIKGKTDEIEDKIDMEALKEIGINIKSGK